MRASDGRERIEARRRCDDESGGPAIPETAGFGCDTPFAITGPANNTKSTTKPRMRGPRTTDYWRWGGLVAADACQRADRQRGLCPRQRSNICCCLKPFRWFCPPSVCPHLRSVDRRPGTGGVWVFVYYFRRLALMVSSHLAAIIEPKKIAIVTSAQSGKLSITIPGICAPTRPFSSPSGLSPITPPKGRSHTASEPVVRAHHRETLGIANPCRRLPKLRKGDCAAVALCPSHGRTAR